MTESKPPPASYEVGNCKPPVATRFKPGQSGNPAGKKPGTKSLKTMFVKAALAPPRVRWDKDNTRHYATQIEAVIGNLFDEAAHGREKAREKVLALWPALVDDAGLEESGSAEPDAPAAAESDAPP